MKQTDQYQIPLRFKLARPIAKAFFRGIFHILARVKITGKENIPYGQPYVAAMNHVSIFDPPFVAAFWPEPIEIIGASDVFGKPGQGQLLRIYGVIPVHRGDYDRSLITRIVSIVRSGHPLLIAPEGGRSHVTAMRRAKPGVAYVIEQTGAPVCLWPSSERPKISGSVPYGGKNLHSRCASASLLPSDHCSQRWRETCHAAKKCGSGDVLSGGPAA